jgi:chromosome segregation ATPase
MSTTGTTTTADLSLTIRPEVLLVEIANKYQAMRAEIARLSAELDVLRENLGIVTDSACRRVEELAAARRLVDECDAVKLGLATELDALRDELARTRIERDEYVRRSLPSGREPCDWMSNGGAGDP